MASSIAILTDSAHMLLDLFSFFIAITALLVSKKPPQSRMSFGYHRAEVLGALLGVVLIWGLTIWLIYEGV